MPVIISIGMTFLIFTLFTTFLQNTVFRVLITGKFPTDTKVIVSSIDASGTPLWSEEIIIKNRGRQSPEFEGTGIINAPIRRLRLEFFKLPSTSKEPTKNKIVIHNIQLPMPYSTDYFYGNEQVKSSFTSEQSIPGYSGILEYDENGKIRLDSNHPIGKNNPLMTIGMSLLFGFGIWLITKNSKWSSIPAFSDMSLGNQISSSAEFDAVNGVRGLAALLVLLSHTAPGFGENRMGLALLFVISGFLLSKPFILDPRKIYSWENIQRYLTKRLKRILPMYYLFIFITYVISFQFNTALRHFFFIQAEGHLWPMTQIFTFYMLLPLVLLITSFLYRINRLLPIIFLGLGSYFWYTFASGWLPYFNGAYSHPFFLYAFLIGVLISYVYYDLIENSERLNQWQNQYGSVFAVFVLVFVILIIAWSAPVTPPVAIASFLNNFFVKSILAASMVVVLLFTAKTWLAKLTSNWLFRSIGVTGFSFYLLHGMGIQIAGHILHIDVLTYRSWEFTAMAFCFTYVLAILAYSYVERPFFGYRENRAKTERW